MLDKSNSTWYCKIWRFFGAHLTELIYSSRHNHQLLVSQTIKLFLIGLVTSPITGFRVVLWRMTDLVVCRVTHLVIPGGLGHEVGTEEGVQVRVREVEVGGEEAGCWGRQRCRHRHHKHPHVAGSQSYLSRRKNNRSTINSAGMTPAPVTSWLTTHQ